MIVHFDNTIGLSALPPLQVFYLQKCFYLFQSADRIGRGKLLGRQSLRVEPELVDPRLAGTEYVGLEAVADHQRLVAAGVGIDQGKVEDALVRFLDTSVFRQDHPLEIRRQAGVAQFLVLHFAEAVRQDIQAVDRKSVV